MTTFHRYVAIGDSTTEGLEDPYPDGTYRGWADRLAEHVANAQDEPLHYANLAVRGLRLDEILTTQLDAALALEPDLMTIVGGVNDVIGLRCDLAALRRHLGAMFEAARSRDITVLTFTMPDPVAVNPLVRHVRPRMFGLNDVIRSEAERCGVLVVDFEQYPTTQDRRLWFEDRLHINPLGHERVAAALAWRLGLEGTDDSWAEPLAAEPILRRLHEELRGHLDWSLRYFAPWLGRAIRGISYSSYITAKRPVPTEVVRTLDAGSPAPSSSRAVSGARRCAGFGDD